MRILKKRKSVPKPYFTNKMLEKSVTNRNPNPTKIKQKAIFCKRTVFWDFERAHFLDFFGNLWDVLLDLSTRVGSAVLMHRPSQRYLIGPSTWLLSRKQDKDCLFSWAFVQPFVPPELGAAGMLEAPIFPRTKKKQAFKEPGKKTAAPKICSLCEPLRNLFLREKMGASNMPAAPNSGGTNG